MRAAAAYNASTAPDSTKGDSRTRQKGPQQSRSPRGWALRETRPIFVCLFVEFEPNSEGHLDQLRMSASCSYPLQARSTSKCLHDRPDRCQRPLFKKITRVRPTRVTAPRCNIICSGMFFSSLEPSWKSRMLCKRCAGQLTPPRQNEMCFSVTFRKHAG